MNIRIHSLTFGQSFATDGVGGESINYVIPGGVLFHGG